MTVRQSGALEANVGPAIVHCSAGIGRSGTFCLVDSSLVIVSYCGIIKILGCLPVFVCEVYVPWNQQKKIHTCEPLWVQLWVRTEKRYMYMCDSHKAYCTCTIHVSVKVNFHVYSDSLFMKMIHRYMCVGKKILISKYM